MTSRSPALALSSTGKKPSCRRRASTVRPRLTEARCTRRPPDPAPRCARLDDVPSQLAALETMTVGARREVPRALRRARSRNRAYLKKRLAWRIQELAEAALAGRHRAHPAARRPDAGALADAPQSQNRRSGRRRADARRGAVVRRPSRAIRAFPGGHGPAPRLRWQDHEVTVCAEGFEYGAAAQDARPSRTGSPARAGTASSSSGSRSAAPPRARRARHERRLLPHARWARRSTSDDAVARARAGAAEPEPRAARRPRRSETEARGEPVPVATAPEER